VEQARMGYAARSERYGTWLTGRTLHLDERWRRLDRIVRRLL
jgi:hypothetical protein